MYSSQFEITEQYKVILFNNSREMIKVIKISEKGDFFVTHS